MYERKGETAVVATFTRQGKRHGVDQRSWFLVRTLDSSPIVTGSGAGCIISPGAGGSLAGSHVRA